VTKSGNDLEMICDDLMFFIIIFFKRLQILNIILKTIRLVFLKFLLKKLHGGGIFLKICDLNGFKKFLINKSIVVGFFKSNSAGGNRQSLQTIAGSCARGRANYLPLPCTTWAFGFAKSHFRRRIKLV